MQYIHELIKGPEEGISCQDLYAPKISGDYNPFTEKPDSNADIGMSAADEIIDQATIDSVRLKKEEAKKELESLLLSGGPNSEEEEERERELDAEIEGLDKYLSKGTDKQGKPKTVSPNDKKNIQNKVCNAIGRAIKEIKSHNPEVGKYFEKMIDKGSTCLFKDHSSEWYT